MLTLSRPAFEVAMGTEFNGGIPITRVAVACRATSNRQLQYDAAEENYSNTFLTTSLSRRRLFR